MASGPTVATVHTVAYVTAWRIGAVTLGGGPMQLGDAVGAATLTAPSGVATDTGNVRITSP